METARLFLSLAAKASNCPAFHSVLYLGKTSTSMATCYWKQVLALGVLYRHHGRVPGNTSNFDGKPIYEATGPLEATLGQNDFNYCKRGRRHLENNTKAKPDKSAY